MEGSDKSGALIASAANYTASGAEFRASTIITELSSCSMATRDRSRVDGEGGILDGLASQGVIAPQGNVRNFDRSLTSLLHPLRPVCCC